MDFTFTPEQDEAAELAAKILGDRATNERMKAVEADGSRVRPRPVGRAGLGRAARARPAGGVRRRGARAGRALPGAGRGRPDRGAGAPGGTRARGTAAGRARQRRPEAAVAARRRHGRQRAHGRGRRGARVRSRAAHDRGRGGRRRLPADRQQGHRPGGSLRRPVPGAGRDAVRRRRLPGRARRRRGDRDRADVLRPRHRGPGRPRRRRARRPTGWSDRPTAPCDRQLRHLLLLAGSAEQLGICEGALEAHRGVRQDAGAVRPSDRDLPGGLAAAGGRLHRHPGAAARALAGRLADRGGTACRHRGRDRQAVGGRRRPPDRAHDRARARRGRDRPRRRGAPLLHLGQALRVPARRRHRAGAAHRADPRRPSRPDRWPRPSSSCCASAPRTTTSG